MKKIIPFMIAAAMLLAACGAPQKHNQNDAKGAIMAAEQANKKAKKAQYEWRDTGKIIKKAKKASKEGEFDKAVKLANKAKKQAASAYKQYLENKNAGPRI